LLKILRGFLGDAYIAVRGSSTLSSDIISELIDLGFYLTQRVLSPKTFVSDAKLARHIKAAIDESEVRKQALQSSLQPDTAESEEVNAQDYALTKKERVGKAKMAWSFSDEAKNNKTKVMPLAPGSKESSKDTRQRVPAAQFSGSPAAAAFLVEPKDIIVPKTVDGEAKTFAADRAFLYRALNGGKASARATATKGSKGNEDKVHKILDLLIERLGVTRSVGNDGMTPEPDDNGDVDIHLAEINDFLSLNWSEVGAKNIS
jgi:hypothetical protein